MPPHRLRTASSRPEFQHGSRRACGHTIFRPLLTATVLALAGLPGSQAQAQPAGPAQAAGTTSPPAPGPLSVASWNLGWHLDRDQALQWIEACSAPFARNAEGLWAPHPGGERAGWSLRWGRDAPIVWNVRERPPCDVWQLAHKPLPVTPGADAKRRAQIADRLEREVQADVIAFQEVSGVAAVREILPVSGTMRREDFHVCSYEGYGVQRLAFAWRKSLGGLPADCRVEDALSLPGRPDKERPRPGLALTLKLGGRPVHFLNVHLKSGCVSPLESTDANGRGRLDGDDPACTLLRAQVPPLEAWIERLSASGEIVLLGDFNRQLAHEAGRPSEESARNPAGRTRNLLREIDDGEPAASDLHLLDETCPVSAAAQAACQRAAAGPEAEAVKALARPEALGCRNPVGLDHILVSRAIQAEPARHLALGRYGRSLSPRPGQPDPLLALSDHCPLVTRLRPP